MLWVWCFQPSLESRETLMLFHDNQSESPKMIICHFQGHHADGQPVTYLWVILPWRGQRKGLPERWVYCHSDQSQWLPRALAPPEFCHWHPWSPQTAVWAKRLGEKETIILKNQNKIPRAEYVVSIIFEPLVIFKLWFSWIVTRMRIETSLQIKGKDQHVLHLPLENP